MGTSFQGACAGLNIIVVGITGTANGVPWDKVLREIYAITRDVRQRVLYDPTAEFVGGFSVGVNAPIRSAGFAHNMWPSRRDSRLAGRINSGASVSVLGIDRVQTNLLIARTTGTSDTGTIFFNPFDSNYLATCGAVARIGRLVVAMPSRRTRCCEPASPAGEPADTRRAE